MTRLFFVTILLKGTSTTTAPVVSKRPRRTTLVMPPWRSSTAISMHPPVPAGPPMPVDAVIPAFVDRWNAGPCPAQKISERFTSVPRTPRRLGGTVAAHRLRLMHGLLQGGGDGARAAGTQGRWMP